MSRMTAVPREDGAASSSSTSTSEPATFRIDELFITGDSLCSGAVFPLNPDSSPRTSSPSRKVTHSAAHHCWQQTTPKLYTPQPSLYIRVCLLRANSRWNLLLMIYVCLSFVFTLDTLPVSTHRRTLKLAQVSRIRALGFLATLCRPAIYSRAGANFYSAVDNRLIF